MGGLSSEVPFSLCLVSRVALLWSTKPASGISTGGGRLSAVPGRLYPPDMRLAVAWDVRRAIQRWVVVHCTRLNAAVAVVTRSATPWRSAYGAPSARQCALVLSLNADSMIELLLVLESWWSSRDNIGSPNSSSNVTLGVAYQEPEHRLTTPCQCHLSLGSEFTLHLTPPIFNKNQL